MNHESKTSSIAKTVQKAVNEIVEPDYVSPCTTNNLSCELATGIEGLFVANIASQILRSVQVLKPTWTFHEFVYMPSTKIEGQCGFDISFGHHAPEHRVRLMHKLITKWCDENWTWHSNLEKANDMTYRCADHVFKLVKQFRDSGGRIRPFLSISVCYCLHEFRRMGTPNIPAFEDARRSVFVGLSELADILRDDFDSKKPNGRVEVAQEVEGARPGIFARWISGDGKIEKALPVFAWPEFENSTRTFLAAD